MSENRATTKTENDTKTVRRQKHVYKYTFRKMSHGSNNIRDMCSGV